MPLLHGVLSVRMVAASAQSPQLGPLIQSVVEHLRENSVSRHLVSSVVLVVALLLLRWLILKQVSRSDKLSDDLRRRWMVQVRNALLVLLALGLLLIWGEELRTFALSAVAIAAALVLATKELIMCISGTILEGASHAFRVGDRIEIDGVRGDVYDQTLLSTTILEVGPGPNAHQHTGRVVVIPNSKFLTSSIINETFTEEYILHAFTVPMKLDDDWRSMERRLLDAARDICAPYMSAAQRHMEEIARERGLRTLSTEPRVTLQLPEPGRVNLYVRVPVPARRRGRIEQEILRRAIADLPPAGDTAETVGA